MRLRHLVRYSIIRAGLPVPPRADMFLQMMAMGHWMRQQGGALHIPERPDYFKWVNDEHLGGGPIDYLEFGVFRGTSTRLWVETNTDPKSRFFGFDTFTGLPEAWRHGTGTMGVGHFDVGGNLPDIDDDRVEFVQGVFQDTLVPFLGRWKRTGRLVLHFDADLYSSTLYVLAKLDAHIQPDDVLMFDQANVSDHEWRALMDWASAFRREVRLLATSGRDYPQVAVQVTK